LEKEGSRDGDRGNVEIEKIRGLPSTSRKGGGDASTGQDGTGAPGLKKRELL